MSQIRVKNISSNENSIEFIGITTFSGSGAITLPGGSSNTRPEIPQEGQIRYINGELRKTIEYYDGSSWISL